MFKFLVPVVLAVGLGACTGVQMGEVDHNAYAQFAVGQVRAWNAAGIDPLQLDEDKLVYLVALCGTVVGALDAGLIVMEDIDSDAVLQYCEAAIVASGPAVNPNEREVVQ